MRTRAPGRRTFELTDEGRAYVEENREALGSPWDEAGEGVPSQFVELRALVGQLAAATIQVAQAGTPEQAEQAKEVLTEARKSLYRILAEAE